MYTQKPYVRLQYLILYPLNIRYSINFCRAPYMIITFIQMLLTCHISDRNHFGEMLPKCSFPLYKLLVLTHGSTFANGVASFRQWALEERSRFSYTDSLNCTHGKYLHFKGLLHVCIMFDTDARASLVPG